MCLLRGMKATGSGADSGIGAFVVLSYELLVPGIVAERQGSRLESGGRPQGCARSIRADSVMTKVTLVRHRVFTEPHEEDCHEFMQELQRDLRHGWWRWAFARGKYGEYLVCHDVRGAHFLELVPDARACVSEDHWGAPIPIAVDDYAYVIPEEQTLPFAVMLVQLRTILPVIEIEETW
jgi:hypothetical protein